MAKPVLKSLLLSLVAFAHALLAGAAVAEKKYDAGVTDNEIKIGNIAPYSGPVSAVSTVAKIEAAYFNKVNDEGGVGGRKIKFVSYDDGYSPPKTVEQARKLIESDEVLFVFNPVGTAQNAAIQKYLNGKKIPQLFVGSGASRWNDPSNFPWTMGWSSDYRTEGEIFAKYVLQAKPAAKIAVLYQNDDLGRDYLRGLKDGLGGNANMIIAEESFEVSEPTIESHIVKLKASGADVLLNIGLPKSVAQTIRKVAELGWSPLQIIPNIASSITNTIKPVGYDKAQGIVSTSYLKDITDTAWKDDDGVRKYKAFLAKYAPAADPDDQYVLYGYSVAQTLIRVLEQCGDTLTRDNVMRQAASLKDFSPDLILPNIKLNTGRSDFAPIERLQLMRFKGEKWELFGDVIGPE